MFHHSFLENNLSSPQGANAPGDGEKTVRSLETSTEDNEVWPQKQATRASNDCYID